MTEELQVLYKASDLADHVLTASEVLQNTKTLHAHALQFTDCLHTVSHNDKGTQLEQANLKCP